MPEKHAGFFFQTFSSEFQQASMDIAASSILCHPKL
jgi:hypothetical protein